MRSLRMKFSWPPSTGGRSKRKGPLCKKPSRQIRGMRSIAICFGPCSTRRNLRSIIKWKEEGMFDISLNPKEHRFCNGVSRRDFLRVGALAPLGLGLGNLLAFEKLMAAEPASRVARAKSIILVYLGGGISHHDTFDMKPEAVEEIRGKYKSIPSNVTGLHVCELLPKMAKTMDKVCLIRSGSHENDHHETATNWVLCGRFGSPFGDYPAMGAVVAHESGFSGMLPPYVAVPKNACCRQSTRCPRRSKGTIRLLPMTNFSSARPRWFCHPTPRPPSISTRKPRSFAIPMAAMNSAKVV